MSDEAYRPVILIVDDTEDIRELIQAGLTRQGFRVLQADGGKTMDAVLETTPVDLIVLDSMMPGEDGLSICARLAASGPPVIMLSAAGDDLNRLKGLNLGAEDYMAKPFNMDELAVRIRIVLRRMTPQAPRPVAAETVSVFGWSLDARTRWFTSPAGKVLQLSPAEFAALSVFLDIRDRPIRRDELLKRMSQVHDDSTDRSLDALISRLRRKLKYADPDSPDLIETVYGVGYALRAK